jgi:hypothetical protein
MKELFVPYEIALGLKEIGFDLACIAYYRIDEVERTGDIMLNYSPRGKEIDSETLRDCDEYKKHLKARHVCGYICFMRRHRFVAVAPTWDQAFEWFLEKHRLLGYISHRTVESKLLFFPVIVDKDNLLWEDIDCNIESHKEAQSIVLKKMIEMVENRLI